MSTSNAPKARIIADVVDPEDLVVDDALDEVSRRAAAGFGTRPRRRTSSDPLRRARALPAENPRAESERAAQIAIGTSRSSPPPATAAADGASVSNFV